ncbi:hypothetical protein KY290_001420 [Solanum tuberosum]|uniref:Uncharacterized protein n=1 Tax=Solanum tuberosum TaxID=4113 RepID=A0ABQ7WM35_SOLTU|nr:hypothetical protein KY290_001420 [Solanum tuberosum]
MMKGKKEAPSPSPPFCPPHSLDREDHQDFAIRCRIYSNSKSSDRIGIAPYVLRLFGRHGPSPG